MATLREYAARAGGMSVIAYLAAVVLFVLAGLGVDVGSLSELDLVSFGLAAFAAGHIVPG